MYQVVLSWNKLALFGDMLARCSPVLGEQLGNVATVTIVVREFAEDIVTKDYAKSHPKTTVVEKVKVGPTKHRK